MPSLLCTLEKAAPEMLDDIILNEVYYIVDDMDETTFTFGTDRSIKLKTDVILKSALDCAPDKEGKAWLGRIIYATDGAKERLTQIAELFFQEMLLPMKIRGLDRLTAVKSSAYKTGTQDSLTDSPPISNPDPLRTQLLQRDGHACCITGHSSNPSLNKTTPNIIPLDDSLEIAHIFPYSLGDSFDDHEGGLNSAYDPCTFWEVVSNYAPSVNAEWLRSEGLDSPSNTLILCRTLHKAFVNLELFFTESQHIPGQYEVRNTIRDPWLGSTNFNAVTFSNHSTQSEIALPDPKLLRFHAAIATILRKTHARRVLDRTIKEAMQLEHFAQNGSTDARSVCLVLMARFKSPSVYF